MPGFNICGTGEGPAATMETRRKHRWVFEALIDDGIFPRAERLILQKAQRPNFKFEEPEMHHNQEVAYFAGKQSWEPITLTWYDAEQPADVSQSIWNWIELVVNFAQADVNPPAAYKKEALLGMTSGIGYATSEQWRLCNCWPKSTNWGELDYTNTEIATIDCEMRFDRAMKTK